ncbi:MAG: DNA repair protein RecO [Chloroflexota bacterium]
MANSRLYNTEAIVLKAKDMGEADRLLILFTPYRGKLKAVVRGARRSKSKLGGHCQELSHCQMLLAQGKTFDVVTQCQSLQSYLPLRRELGRLSQALYMCELVDDFSPEGLESLSLFRLLVSCLEWLCEARDGDVVLRYFELQLLGLSGYRPQLLFCLGCHSPLHPVRNYFTPYGGVLCPRCQYTNPQSYSLSVAGLKVMRFLQEAGIPQARRLRIDPEVNLEVGSLLRAAVIFCTEREVKSGVWLDWLKAEMPQAE